MSGNMNANPKVFELAEYFLSEKPFTRDEAMSLAIDIQQAVEDWFSDREQ